MAIQQAVDGEAWGVTGRDCKWWLDAKPDAEWAGGGSCVRIARRIARSGPRILAQLREMAQVGELFPSRRFCRRRRRLRRNQ